MLAVVGMWIAIVGYGLAYTGAVKLGGQDCGVIAAFQGKCGQGTHTASAPVAGQTQQGRLLSAQGQQAAMIGTQPIPQAA